MSCFITKGFDKKPITASYVLNECKNAEIGFEIKEDIEQLANSLDTINNSTTTGGTDVLSTLKSILQNIYVFGRFVVSFIVHVLVSTLNVIILALRCIGFTSMNYIHISNGGGGGGRGTTTYPIIY